MIKADLCVIGAGSGGLSVAAGAAQMGAEVVLVEAGAMGGDCLNTGCVPSKALLAAAKAAHHVRAAERFGITAQGVAIDPAKVWGHVHGTIDAIAPHDSQERFEGLGVKVIRAHGHFIDPKTLSAGGELIRAKRFVVATGAKAAVPAIPGLDDVAFLTNENLFSLDSIPDHLIVVGGGPIGVEMAQAFVRLGARVTLIEADRLLAREDPELVESVRASLKEDGVNVLEGHGVSQVAAGPKVVLSDANAIEGSHLLIATGRVPNVSELGLKAAGVEYDKSGIKVDARLRTSNKRVFAIGDVVGGPQFTHVAGYHAAVVMKNVLFRFPAKADHALVPRVTYCDPELAQIGDFRGGPDDRVLCQPFADNDRARTEGIDAGLVKIVVDAKGWIKGVGMVGAGAGDLIQPWLLAMKQGVKVGDMATLMLPYPSMGEAAKRAAGDFFTPTLYGPKVRALVKVLGWLP